MPIDVRCRDCEVTYRVPETAAGKRIRCQSCERLLQIPEASESIPERSKQKREVGESVTERRDRALFGDIENESEDPPVADVARREASPPKRKLRPPKDVPATVAPDHAQKKSERKRLRARRPQAGGNVKDKLVFATGLLLVLGVLAVFAPALLYLIGIGFFWLAYIWVVADAYEESGSDRPSTWGPFLLFRLLTRPIHLWPAIVFLILGFVAEMMASGHLHFVY